MMLTINTVIVEFYCDTDKESVFISLYFCCFVGQYPISYIRPLLLGALQPPSGLELLHFELISDTGIVMVPNQSRLASELEF